MKERSGEPLPASEPVLWAVIAASLVALWAVGATLSRWIGPWSGIGGAAIILGGGVLILLPRTCRSWLRPTNTAAGILAGAVMVGATYLLYPLAVRLHPDLARQVAYLYRLFGAPSLQMAGLLPAIILGEELVWRGVVQGVLQAGLRGRAPKLVPAALSAVVYAGAHAPAGYPLLTLVALLCGLYWSMLRARSGSVFPALLAHLIWDAAVFLVAPLERPF